VINTLWLLFAFSLVLLNAFFVAAEFGMVKLRHTRVQVLQGLHGIRGRTLAKVHKNLDAYLSACQLGITLASLGLGWVGEPAFSHLLHPLFTLLPFIPPEVAKVISFSFAFLLLSFLHIVVGELMPKTWAIRQAERISLWTATPLFIFYWVMYPAIWVLNTCSTVLLKVMGLGAKHHAENFYSTKEIKLILGASRLYGELTQAETEIIEHTLDFADLKVTEVMRPWADMVALDIQQPAEQLLNTVLEHRYSRYPVYAKLQQEIIGIIHIKDLFTALYKNQVKVDATPVDLSAMIRPVLKVTHDLPALDMLYQFREGTSHFAVVYNDKKRLIGFITWDNLLHVLFGHVKDEFHKTQDNWILNPDGTLRVRGDCTIYALEKVLQRDIAPETEEANTLAGLILNQVGFMPKEGEHVQFAAFEAVVEKIRGARIQWVRVVPHQQDHAPLV